MGSSGEQAPDDDGIAVILPILPALYIGVCCVLCVCVLLWRVYLHTKIRAVRVAALQSATVAFGVVLHSFFFFASY